MNIHPEGKYMETDNQKGFKGVESEIRKDVHRNNFFRLIQEDIDTLLNPVRDEFESVDCPTCGNNDNRNSFDKGQFSFSSCPRCDTLFVNPRPLLKHLEIFYQHSKAIAASTQSLFDNEQGRRKHIFEPRARDIIKVLNEHGISEGRLVEIGCSIGTFLDILRDESDFSVEGIDPSPGALEITRQRGLTVYQTTLENFEPGQDKYDVALSFETLEHIFSPQEFLLHLNRVIRKDGFLVFTTPNYHGFDMLVLGKYYKNICAPSHLNYFNVDTIDLLLERTGFQVIKKMTPGILDLEIVRKQITEGVAPDIPPVIRHLAFGVSYKVQRNFQRFLQENCLSGNMLVFAQKKEEAVVECDK